MHLCIYSHLYKNNYGFKEQKLVQKLLTSTLSKDSQNQKDVFYLFISLLNFGHPTYL